MQQLETGGRDDIGIAPRTLHLVLFPSQRTELLGLLALQWMEGERDALECLVVVGRLVTPTQTSAFVTRDSLQDALTTAPSTALCFHKHSTFAQI